jgi:hypothetical protein
LTVVKVSLIHTTAEQEKSEVYFTTFSIPRIDLGSYVIDLATHETKLSKVSDVIIIEKGRSNSYIFYFRLKSSKTSATTVYPFVFTDMLKTNWLKSKLAIKYIGKDKVYLLSADLIKGVDSKHSVTLY